MHNKLKIQALATEIAYWDRLAKGGEANEVSIETRRMARTIVRRLNKDLAKLVREEVKESQ